VTVYVIDASAGADLLLDTANGRAIEDAVEPNAEWWVPEHYYAEVMSLLRRSVRVGDINEEEATDLVGRLSRSTPHRAQLRTMLVETWALRHNLTPYDAFYVVLARQLGATLVSTDERLKRSPNLRVPLLPLSTDE
jgi:predicted nucleic acid-binding protein